MNKRLPFRERSIQTPNPARDAYHVTFRPIHMTREKVVSLLKKEKDAILLLADSVVAKHTIREMMGP